MADSTLDSPYHPLLLAAGALSLLAAGFALGQLTAEARGEQLEPAPVIVPGAALRDPASPGSALAEQLQQLRAGLDGLRADLDHRSTAMPLAVPAMASTERVPVAAAAGDAAAWRELAQRLLRIETLQRQLLTASRLEIAIPPGTDVRDFFAALKSSSNSDDVARAHHLWTYAQVRAAYGDPDQIDEHDDYIEWIYRLGEDEQFDFHFVNGMCVLAH